MKLRYNIHMIGRGIFEALRDRAPYREHAYQFPFPSAIMLKKTDKWWMSTWR